MKTVNGGQNWVDVASVLPNPQNYRFEYLDVSFCPSSPATLYVLASINGGGCVLYRSNDYGTTFTIVNSSFIMTQPNNNTYSFGLTSLLVSPVDENVLYLYAGVYAAKSNNGGIGFTQIPTCHADVRHISISVATPGGFTDVIETATDGGIATHTYSISAFPVEISKNGPGLNITQFFGMDVAQNNGDFIAGGSQDNAVAYRYNGIWRINGGCDCYQTAIDDDCENNVFYAAFCGSGSKFGIGSLNTPGQWIYNATTLSNGNYRYDRPLVQNPLNSLIYVAQNDVSSSTTDCINQGYNFTTQIVANNVNAPYKIFALDVNVGNPNYITVAYNKISGTATPSQIVFRSADGGQNWTDISANLSACQWFLITDLISDPTNPNRIWATVGGFDMNSQRRVYYTGNGGTTWTDVSSGMPVFPANCIIYEEGTNDNLYVGTDEGVYYHNATMTSPYWQPFMNGIPLSANVLDLKINYCRKEIYAATFGRGIWKSLTASANPANTSAAQAPQTITTNTTWSGNRIINGDLVVAPGATLTISGANTKLLVSENRKIIVQRGAKLIIDGATISNGCGKKWYGIEVWGNQTLSQLPLSTTPQGYVEIRNGATLQHMQEGVITDRAGYSGYHGGIIVGNNAVFRDNLKAVQILSYLNFTTGGGSAANLCMFTNCTFEITAGWPSAFGPAQKQVRMDAVEDVKFRACTFRNTATAAQLPTASRGTAIESLDARYSLEGYCAVAGCSNPVRSRVEGFYYGINTSAANPLKTMAVTYTDFVNNERGMLLTGLNYATVALCTFSTNGALSAYGLYLDACSGYQVEQNGFSSPTANNGFGLYVRNSNSISNLNGYGNTNIVYNNSFNGFFGANIAYDDNDGPATYDGVRFNCNDYSNNQYDIRALNLSASINTDIGQYQGTSTSAFTVTRNRFLTNNCQPNQYNQFDASKSSPQLIRYQTNTQTQLIPQCRHPLVTVTQNSYLFNKPVHCPNNFGGSGSGSGNRTTQLENIAEQRNRFERLTAKFDGGQTEIMLNRMTQGTDVSTQLMQHWPYISDGVLEAVQHTQPDVVAALRSDSSALQLRQASLDSLIQAGFERDIAVNAVITSYLNDTLISNVTDSIAAVLQLAYGTSSDMILSWAALTDGDTTEVQQYNDSLSMQANVQEASLALLNELLLQLNAAPSPLALLQSDATLLQQFRTLAADSLGTGATSIRASESAQAVLRFYLGENYPELFGTASANVRENIAEESVSGVVQFSVFPNPASDLITFAALENDTTVALVQINIYSVTGQLVASVNCPASCRRQTIPVAALPEGLYIYELTDHNHLRQTGRVLVQHP
jgi:hypothetical protein